MLSERDRRALNDIETQLCEEDPDFACCFTDWNTATVRDRSWPYTAIVGFFLAMAAVSLVLALEGLFWLMILLAGITFGLRRWRLGTSPRSPEP